jgi:hypothetical protein
MRQAKREARLRGETLTSMIEKGLRHQLGERKPTRSRRVQIPVFRGGSGTKPGVDLTNSAALLDIMDGVK